MSRSTPLGTLLRLHRLNQDLTLERLSELSGITDRAIGDIERGNSAAPRRHTVAALAEALSLDETQQARFLDAARTSRHPDSVQAAPEGERFRPHWLDDFTGREAEVAQLSEMLTSRTLASPVIISGGPGVGKTSLAVETVRRARPAGHRELFLDLQGVGDRPLTPFHVVRGLLSQLTGGADMSRSYTEAVGEWAAATASEPVMVILDDAAMESQIRAVLSGDSRSRLIVTSRRTLPGIEGAQHLALSAFSREQSICLLEESIPSVLRSDADVLDLAILCDDLPLALRIAAGRISSQPNRTARDFITRLSSGDRRLGMLIAGDLAVERAFAASYRQLDLHSRTLFQNLALLNATSSFSADAAVAVHAGDVTTLDLLDELVDLGLVEALRGGRFRLHELLRLYATQQLHADASAEQVRARVQRLDEWMLHTAALHGLAFAPQDESPKLEPAGSDETAREWLISEADYWWAAVRRAAAAGDDQRVCEASAGIQWFGDRWLEWGHWHEFFAILASSARVVGDRNTEAAALGDIAYMHLYETFDYAEAGVAARRALEAAALLGSQEYRGWALTHLSGSATHTGDLAAGAEHAREAIAAFAEAGNLEGELQARQGLADVLRLTDPAAALAELDQVLTITAAPTPQLSEYTRLATRASALNSSAKTLVILGRFDEARRTADALLEIATDASYQARALRHRGLALLGLGRPREARSDLTRALQLAGEHRPDDWAEEIETALAQIDDASFEPAGD